MILFQQRLARWGLPLLIALTLAAGVVSLFVGAGGAVGATPDGEVGYFFSSRVPRTLALILAGVAMALSGMIMQMLARNRFAEPSTAGTIDSATLGVLMVMIFAPGMPVLGKMIAGTIAALIGTGIFMLILRRMPLRDPLMVPLVGIMLGGVIGAVTSFLAYRLDLLQALTGLQTANFSAMMQGRYELMWLALVLSVIAFIAADRFTVAGLGDDMTTNLGLNYGRIVAIGLIIVAMNTALVVVHVGAIPFIGLIVPNLVAMALGDNVRRTAPWVALLGAFLVLVCDIIGRLVNWPYELPLGLVMSVVGAAIFLVILLRPERSKVARA
ncbi:ABC transporter permease [Gulosibacter macacae]|uniref:ABC transporter permease n=1 Tax=Gulosibacter macacae TaxID=2488791 RepID=UPI001F2D9725|nr:iron chelate uptake ABC transporter family permease subunit [Gulosibacter macacae]